jgi:hypothetical protein
MDQVESLARRKSQDGRLTWLINHRKKSSAPHHESPLSLCGGRELLNIHVLPNAGAYVVQDGNVVAVLATDETLRWAERCEKPPSPA